MKKRQGQSEQHQLYHTIPDRNHNADQSHKRGHFSNVSDLVTHKEKLIDKKPRTFATNRFQDDHVNQFEEEMQEDRKNYVDQQAEDQMNEQVLSTINNLMLRNKINKKTAFNFPILNVKSFYERGNEDDIFWKKVTSIYQNANKIYGFRIDLIQDEVMNFNGKFQRSNLQQVVDKDKQNGRQDKQQKTIKFADLMSTQVKNNLMLHLQKNSESLDINLRTKLMMRKDPLFERTSRKFDHSSYSSFFMNTISLSQGLYMQINACQGESAKGKQVDEKSESIDEEKEDKSEIINQKHKQAIQSALIENISNLAFLHEMQSYRSNVQILGTKIFHNSVQSTQEGKKYEKILDMILKGQLKSAFEYGQSFNYDNMYEEQDGSSISDEESRFHKVEHRIFHEEGTENKTKKIVKVQEQQMEEQNQVQIKFEPGAEPPINQGLIGEIQNLSINASQPELPNPHQIQIMPNEVVIDEISSPNIPQVPKVERKQRKITQVIKVRQPQQKSSAKGTRAKRAPKDPSKTKPKIPIPPEQKQKMEKSMFNTPSKLVAAKILKKQKFIDREIYFQSIQERNLIQPSIDCNYQTRYLIQLRPTPTKQELKMQRRRLRQQLLQQKGRVMQPEENQNNNNQNPLTLPPSQTLQQPPQHRPQNPLINLDSSQQQISQNNPCPTILKTQTITTVKQNIYSIVKSARRITFKNLQIQYCRLFGNISTATIFIGMLHLSNQRFIKSVQQNMKDFNISIL